MKNIPNIIIYMVCYSIMFNIMFKQIDKSICGPPGQWLLPYFPSPRLAACAVVPQHELPAVPAVTGGIEHRHAQKPWGCHGRMP